MAALRGWRGWLAAMVLLAALALLPLVATRYLLSVMIVVGLHGIVALGLNLLMGYAGQVSLGQAAFYGIGAYASASLTVKFGVSPWLALVIGMVLAGLVAYAVGIPTFRLQGLYLSLATMGVGVIIYIILVEWISVTGGPSGIPAIPYLSLGGFEFNTDLRYYYLTLAAAVPCALTARSLVSSRIGRALRAVHGSEAAAGALGVDVSRFKLQTFILSAVYASLAGSLYAHYVTFISPVPFNYMESVSFLTMSMLGGAGSIAGAFVGAGITSFLREVLQDNLPKLIPGAGGEVETVFFGLLLTLIMIYMPEGITAAVGRLWQRMWAGQAQRGRTSPQSTEARAGQEEVASGGTARG